MRPDETATRIYRLFALVGYFFLVSGGGCCYSAVVLIVLVLLLVEASAW
jgi:hypothetical protein